MTILYSNGCSYTANNLVNRDQRYPLLLGNRLLMEVMDRAIPGSNNRKIIRSTMRDCIKLLDTNTKIVAMIQLTHIPRTEYAGKPNESTLYKYGEDDLFESVKPGIYDNMPDYVKTWADAYYRIYNENAEVTRLLSELIGLISFFQRHGIKYLIYTGPRIFYINPNDIFYQYLLKDKNVLDLLGFNMLSLSGQDQHPDINGMIKIADFFFERLVDLTH